MEDQVSFFAKSPEAVLRDVIPERFLRDIQEISVIPLKAKFSDSVWKKASCANVHIALAKSPFYMDGGDAILCKLINGSAFYFPDLKDKGVFEAESDTDLQAFSGLVAKRLESLFPASPFGCCGRYKECSEAGRCIHSNAFYAPACNYKAHLEAGRNFYASLGLPE